MARTQKRPAWGDQFRTPSAADLIAGQNRQLGRLIEIARERLLGISGVNERVVWQGVPWHWSMVYNHQHQDSADRPWVYIIPEPGRPIFALPMALDVLEGVSMRKLSRFTRDGIANARGVAGVYWAEWEFSARSQIDEIVNLAELMIAEPA